jgi:AcrR family transcriptional regulator
LPQQRARETRQRIVECAYRVFGRLGYGQATVEDILVEAGISRGAFYHHFAGKEELLKALLSEHTREFDQMMGAVAAASSFREVIDRFVAIWMEHFTFDPHFAPLSLEFRVQATREAWARDVLAGFHRQVRSLIAGVLRTAQSAGIVRTDLDVERASPMLFGLLDGVCLEWAVDPEGVDLQRLRAPVVDLIEGFILAQGAGASDIQAFRDSLAGFLEEFAEGQRDQDHP